MPSLAEAEQRLAQAQCHHGILRDPYGPACEQITAGKHCELQHDAVRRSLAYPACFGARPPGEGRRVRALDGQACGRQGCLEGPRLGSGRFMCSQLEGAGA